MPVRIETDSARGKGKVIVTVDLPALPTLTKRDEETDAEFAARQAYAVKQRQLTVLREAIAEANRANEAYSRQDADIDAEITRLTAERTALKASRPTVVEA